MAKFFRKKDGDNTIRAVTNDDKSVRYGCIGTVADLLKVKILEGCDAPEGTWCFLSSDRSAAKDYFADSKQAVVQHITAAYETP